MSRYYLSERTLRLDEYYVLNWPNVLFATKLYRWCVCVCVCEHTGLCIVSMCLHAFSLFIHNKFSAAIKCLIFNHHAGNSNRCAHGSTVIHTITIVLMRYYFVSFLMVWHKLVQQINCDYILQLALPTKFTKRLNILTHSNAQRNAE